MSLKQYGVKNFIHIANSYVNPDVTTMEGIANFLNGWYCFKFNTSLNDDKLLDMTTEELMVLYQMHRIKDDPDYFNQQTATKTDYEDWLKQEMGEDYVSEEENMAQIENEEKEYTKKIRAKFGDLPDKVITDFSQFQKED